MGDFFVVHKHIFCTFHFAFCILHFAFCTFHFAFFSTASPVQGEVSPFGDGRVVNSAFCILHFALFILHFALKNHPPKMAGDFFIQPVLSFRYRMRSSTFHPQLRRLFGCRKFPFPHRQSTQRMRRLQGLLPSVYQIRSLLP